VKWIVVVFCALAVMGGHARAEPRCIGWAIGGELVGMEIAGLTTVGAYAAAGRDINSPQHEVRNGVILGAAVFVGGTTGSITACAAFGHERHAIPMVPFVIASAAVVAFPAYLGASRALDPGVDNPSDPMHLAKGESAGALSALALTAGFAVGGIGGYYLHRKLFGVHADPAYVAPIASPDLTGVVMVGRF
jgi:hypothetical protein